MENYRSIDKYNVLGSKENMNDFSITPVDRRDGFYGSFPKPRRSIATKSRKLFDSENVEEAPDSDFGDLGKVMPLKSCIPLESVPKLDKGGRVRPIKSMLGRRWSKTLSPISIKEDVSHAISKPTFLPAAVNESCDSQNICVPKTDMLSSTASQGPRTRSQVKRELETFVIKKDRPLKKMSTIEEKVMSDPFISEEPETLGDKYRDNYKDTSIDLFICNENMVAETCENMTSNNNLESLYRKSISLERQEISPNSQFKNSSNEGSAQQVLSLLANLVLGIDKEKKELDNKLSLFLQQKKAFDKVYDNLSCFNY